MMFKTVRKIAPENLQGLFILRRAEHNLSNLEGKFALPSHT